MFQTFQEMASEKGQKEKVFKMPCFVSEAA